MTETKPRESKMFDHASTVYSAFMMHADLDTHEWHGNNVMEYIAAETKVPKGSVGVILNRLQKCGSIEYERGAINRPALVRLLQAPRRPAWDAAQSSLTRPLSYDKVLRAVKDLQKQIGHLDVVKALVSIEERLGTLDRRLTALESETKRESDAP